MLNSIYKSITKIHTIDFKCQDLVCLNLLMQFSTFHSLRIREIFWNIVARNKLIILITHETNRMWDSAINTTMYYWKCLSRDTIKHKLSCHRIFNGKLFICDLIMEFRIWRLVNKGNLDHCGRHTCYWPSFWCHWQICWEPKHNIHNAAVIIQHSTFVLRKETLKIVFSLEYNKMNNNFFVLPIDLEISMKHRRNL